ncbi:MAG: hypothetical protein U0232_23500 [Thermomicrobiales bacterium]
MVDKTTVLQGMEVYGSDDAFIGVVEQVNENGFMMHDDEIAFGAVDHVERDRLTLRGAGTRYHPQARPDDSVDEADRAGV